MSNNIKNLNIVQFLAISNDLTTLIISVGILIIVIVSLLLFLAFIMEDF